MTQDIAAILANPSDFGFIFQLEAVESDGLEYEGVPIMVVQHLETFDQSFPGVVLKSLDGQSLRVVSQRIARTAREKGITDAEAIKLRNVQWLLGVKAPVSRTVYVGPNGEKFDSAEAAQAAWLNWAETKAA